MQDINELLEDDPFEPFEIELTTGERFVVRHPENMILMRNKCYLFELDGRIARSCRHIAMVHIVRMNKVDDDNGQSGGPDGNGNQAQ